MVVVHAEHFVQPGPTHIRVDHKHPSPNLRDGNCQVAHHRGLAFFGARARQHQHARVGPVSLREEDGRQCRSERLGQQRRLLTEGNQLHAVCDAEARGRRCRRASQGSGGTAHPAPREVDRLAHRHDAQFRHAEVVRHIAGVLQRAVRPLA